MFTLNWHRQFLDIMSECISHRTLPKRRNLPWLNQHIIRGIHECNNAFQKSPNCNSAKRCKVLCNSVTSMIHKSRANYFMNLNPSNMKQFWKTIKYLKKQRSTTPILSVSNVSGSTDSAKATLPNDFFSRCLNKALPPLAQLSDEHQSSYCPDDSLCIEDEVAATRESVELVAAHGTTRNSRTTTPLCMASLTRDADA